MGRFMTEHQEEWFIGICFLFLYPIDRHVCDYGGVVSRNHFSFPIICPEFSVEIFSLPPVSHEVIKAWPLTVIILSHMPLSNVCGGISFRL